MNSEICGMCPALHTTLNIWKVKVEYNVKG